MNRKLQFVIDFLKKSIKNTVYENKIFIIGGCLRDYFNNKNNFNDVDIIVDLEGEEYINFCKYICNINNIRSIYNPFIEKSKHSAVFTIFNNEIISDVRFDVKPRKGVDIKDNLNYFMDFTCNSLYYNVSTNELIEYCDTSISDIKNKLLKSFNDGIFEKSNIRLLRLLRFKVTLGFEIEKNTLNLFENNLHLLPQIPKEHIEYEVKKINEMNNNLEIINLYKKYNIPYKEYGIIEKGEQ